MDGKMPISAGVTPSASHVMLRPPGQKKRPKSATNAPNTMWRVGALPYE